MAPVGGVFRAIQRHFFVAVFFFFFELTDWGRTRIGGILGVENGFGAEKIAPNVLNLRTQLTALIPDGTAGPRGEGKTAPYTASS